MPSAISTNIVAMLALWPPRRIFTPQQAGAPTARQIRHLEAALADQPAHAVPAVLQRLHTRVAV